LAIFGALEPQKTHTNPPTGRFWWLFYSRINQGIVLLVFPTVKNHTKSLILTTRVGQLTRKVAKKSRFYSDFFDPKFHFLADSGKNRVFSCFSVFSDNFENPILRCFNSAEVGQGGNPARNLVESISDY